MGRVLHLSILSTIDRSTPQFYSSTLAIVVNKVAAHYDETYSLPCGWSFWDSQLKLQGLQTHILNAIMRVKVSILALDSGKTMNGVINNALLMIYESDSTSNSNAYPKLCKC